MTKPAAFGMLAKLAMVVSIVLSAGCAPYTRSFVRLSFPGHDVEYEREDCRYSIGAPVWLGFDYHGVRIFASLDDSQAALMGGFTILRVEVPEGAQFSLDEDNVKLISIIGDGDFETVLPLGRGMVFGAATWGARTRPPVVYKPVTATFEGATKKSVTFWGSQEVSHNSVYFSAEEIPRIGDRGQMILPALVIDGVRYPGPTLVFQRDRFFGTASLNC